MPESAPLRPQNNPGTVRGTGLSRSWVTPRVTMHLVQDPSCLRAVGKTCDDHDSEESEIFLGIEMTTTNPSAGDVKAERRKVKTGCITCRYVKLNSLLRVV